MFYRTLWPLVISIFFATASLSATVEEVRQFDRDGESGLSLIEWQIFNLHKDDETFAKYDKNFDGKMSASEVVAINSKAQDYLSSDDQAFRRSYFKQRFGAGGVIPIDQLAEGAAPDKFDECSSQQGFYIRRDKADISVYSGDNIRKDKAKGASVNYTHDGVKDDDTATVNGVASYILLRNPCREATDQLGPNDSFISAYAVAPYVTVDGEIAKGSDDKNTVRIGVDAQAAVFSGGIFNNQYVTISPYYQTDFELDGSAYGLSATYEPYLLSARLGGRIGKPKYLDFYWQTILEADALHVDDPGATRLQAGEEYAWLGGTVKATFGLLPELLDDRVYATAEVKYFWDAMNDRDVNEFGTELGVNLTPDGSTSLSIEYQYGTAKEVLQKADKLQVNLNYKF